MGKRSDHWNNLECGKYKQDVERFNYVGLVAKSDVFKSEWSQQYVNGKVRAMLAQKIGGENVLNVDAKFEGVHATSWTP